MSTLTSKADEREQVEGEIEFCLAEIRRLEEELARANDRIKKARYRHNRLRREAGEIP